MKSFRVAALSLVAGFAASLTEALPARGAGVPHFRERVIATFVKGANSVFATDLDGDGDTDVLSASDFDDRVVWYESDGGSPPTFTRRVIFRAADGTRSVFAADVDGDGDTDVLSASDSSKIAWYENDGGSPPSFTERVISTTASGANSVFAIDVDGDGDTDVLSTSSIGIAWYENDGGSPPTFTERVISNTAYRPASVFATDLDGDGDTDVLSASNNKIAWYESDGGSPPTFTERVISAAVSAALSVFATDLDGDGDIDVLSASNNDNKIAWYESDGGSSPTFTERVISTTATRATSVFATDLDGDGDTDVLSASFQKIAWYESDGGSPPTFTERVISTNAIRPASVFATDVDGDGDTDVLSASSTDNKIVWYENSPPPPDPPGPESPAIRKNRFITLVPENAGLPTLLEVTLVDLPMPYDIWNGKKMFVFHPRRVTELPNSAGVSLPRFRVARLSCVPYCLDFGALGRIDLYGEAIIAGASYEVRAADCAYDLTNPDHYSPPLAISTSVRGDVTGPFAGGWPPPDGSVDFPFDLVAIRDKFSGLPTAPRKARVELMNNCVNLVIDILDIVEAVDAFRGIAYRFVPTSADPCDALCP